MEDEQYKNGSTDSDWRSQNFRDGITNQIQQAAVYFEPPQPMGNRTRDLETPAYSRSLSNGNYIDFVGQVLIRLNVVGNGNRAIEGPKEPAIYDVLDDKAIASPLRHKSRRRESVTGRRHGANSFEATLVHKVGLGPDGLNMNTASSLNAKEEKSAETEAIRDTKGEEKEIKINSQAGQVQCGADDVREYIHRLIREDQEKQIQENKDCFKGDLRNGDFEEKKRAIDKLMDECMAQTVQPPPYMCDQWSHQLYKDPVVTPSGFTYERSGIEDHLKNVGEFDPITRVKLTADQLIPNHTMKKLVDAYISGKPHRSMQSGCKYSKRLRVSKP